MREIIRDVIREVLKDRSVVKPGFQVGKLGYVLCFTDDLDVLADAIAEELIDSGWS